MSDEAKKRYNEFLYESPSELGLKVFTDGYTQGREDAAKIVEIKIEAIQAIRGSTPNLGGALQVLKDVLRSITEAK